MCKKQNFFSVISLFSIWHREREQNILSTGFFYRILMHRCLMIVGCSFFFFDNHPSLYSRNGIKLPKRYNKRNIEETEEECPCSPLNKIPFQAFLDLSITTKMKTPDRWHPPCVMPSLSVLRLCMGVLGSGENGVKKEHEQGAWFLKGQGAGSPKNIKWHRDVHKAIWHDKGHRSIGLAMRVQTDRQTHRQTHGPMMLPLPLMCEVMRLWLFSIDLYWDELIECERHIIICINISWLAHRDLIFTDPYWSA